MLWATYLRPSYDFYTAPLTTKDDKLTYLYNAVAKNDVMALRRFARLEGRLDYTDAHNETILHLAVRKQKVAIFDYLLATRQIQVDARNIFRQTALMLVTQFGDEYFTMKLIECGADVTLDAQVNFFEPSILLYRIILDYSTEFSSELFTKMPDLLDITAPTSGKTILIQACQNSYSELIALLLAHGADVTILDNDGNSAFDLAAKNPDIDLEILYYYFFEDGKKYRINLSTLIGVLSSESSIKSEILDTIEDIDYDDQDLAFLASHLHKLKIEHLIFLLEQYKCIFEDLSQSCLDWLTGFAYDQDEDEDFDTIEKIFLLFHDDELALGFVTSVNKFHQNGLGRAIISLFHQAIPLESLTQLACLILSYGFDISMFSSVLIYFNFGYCELFKILLHMDLVLFDNTYYEDTIVHAIIDVSRKVEDLFAGEISEFYSVKTIEKFLQHFALPSLKKIALKTGDEGLIKKVKEMPRVPLLVELARNAVRDCLINSLKEPLAKWFYTKVQALPIPKNQKQLLTLERKIYF